MNIIGYSSPSPPQPKKSTIGSHNKLLYLDAKSVRFAYTDVVEVEQKLKFAMKFNFDVEKILMAWYVKIKKSIHILFNM